MDRRSFLTQGALGASALCLAPLRPNATKHLIFIVNGGGARKKDYYEDPFLAPNLLSIASDGFVFEQDHCEHVSSHDGAFNELIGGSELVRNAPQVRSLHMVPQMMQQDRPRTLICRENAHDVGHESYEGYLSALRSTDAAIGKVFNWVKSHPYFGGNTAIVIRPEFGRDDEVNAYGHLHHSYGFYYTHRVASIFWGPNIRRGVDRKTVIHSRDMAPALAKLFQPSTLVFPAAAGAVAAAAQSNRPLSR